MRNNIAAVELIHIVMCIIVLMGSNTDSGSIMIGITSNTTNAEQHCYGQADTYCYVYYSNGNKFDKSGNGGAYSQSCTTNDVMTVLVDFDEHTIAFAKNGVDL
eukprot:835516_1